ncbi:MAG TPA: hypothetical protein VIK33_08380 [Anaerolineae bacterium]
MTIPVAPTSSIPDVPRQQIEHLAQTLLDRYQVRQPPVPIERMVAEPSLGLWDVDQTDLSATIGHGLYRYAPRMAQARLLYRAICDSESARHHGLNVPWPASRHEIKYFARCLLIPEAWVRTLPPSQHYPDILSEIFQVPSYDIVTRLAELGLDIPESSTAQTPDPDEPEPNVR